MGSYLEDLFLNGQPFRRETPDSRAAARGQAGPVLSGRDAKSILAGMTDAQAAALGLPVAPGGAPAPQYSPFQGDPRAALPMPYGSPAPAPLAPGMTFQPPVDPRLQPQPAPPQGVPTEGDPQWDATKEFLYRHFTRKGAIENSATPHMPPPEDPRHQDRSAPMTVDPMTGVPIKVSPATPSPPSGPYGGVGGLPLPTGSLGVPRAPMQGPPIPPAPPASDVGPATPGAVTVPDAPPGAPPLVANPDQNAAPTTADTLQDYVKFVKDLYGERPSDNARQDRADKEASGQLERTRLLAQLNFAAGLTASGGGSWKGIAQGFHDAAGAYDEGFAKYQKTLQDSADRYQEHADRQYAQDVNIKGDALRLFSDATEKARARSDKYAKERQDSIDEIFKSEVAGIDKSDFPDPAARQEALRRWQRSRELGTVIPPPEHVADN